jgi:hypothetical protein
MAIMKHRDIETIMPPEVRRRARKGGVPQGKVDWYAGRRYVSNVNSTSQPESDSEKLPSQTRGARRRLKHRSARSEAIRRASGAITRAQASNFLRAIAGWPDRLAHIGRKGFIFK